MITANVDLTEPAKGIVLLTGDHGFPVDPQALLSEHDDRWHIEDSYGDPYRDGTGERHTFLDAAEERDDVVRKWLTGLGIDPADVDIKTEVEY